MRGYRLRRQLMADVAHELRTPLAILQGRIEGLLDGVYPRDETHLAELLEETRHLSRLVEDLGTLAHAEAGALELRKEPVDLGELIRDVAAALPRSIAVEVPADLPTLEADPVRIRQVLLNLLANAMRHTPEEGVIAIEVQALPRLICASTSLRAIGRPRPEPCESLPFWKRSKRCGRSSGAMPEPVSRTRITAATSKSRAHRGQGTEVTVSPPR